MLKPCCARVVDHPVHVLAPRAGDVAQLDVDRLRASRPSPLDPGRPVRRLVHDRNRRCHALEAWHRRTSGRRRLAGETAPRSRSRGPRRKTLGRWCSCRRKGIRRRRWASPSKHPCRRQRLGCNAPSSPRTEANAVTRPRRKHGIRMGTLEADRHDGQPARLPVPGRTEPACATRR